jgi:hypothetical protein
MIVTEGLTGTDVTVFRTSGTDPVRGIVLMDTPDVLRLQVEWNGKTSERTIPQRSIRRIAINN